LVDTLAVYGNVSVVSANDPLFTKVKDKRIFIKRMEAWDIKNIPTFSQGIGVYKFTNNRSDGGAIVNYNSDFSSTDFPIFRLSEAYLMRAEAKFRSGDADGALADINMVRGVRKVKLLTKDELDLTKIYNERGFEFYWEGSRRNDMVRFNKYCEPRYEKPKETPTYKILFPIPTSALEANPLLKQNEGYVSQ